MYLLKNIFYCVELVYSKILTFDCVNLENINKFQATFLWFVELQQEFKEEMTKLAKLKNNTELIIIYFLAINSWICVWSEFG